MGDTREHCVACDVPLSSNNTEYHHWPKPKRSGGDQVVPMCISCHDMIDRFTIDDWPIDWAVRGIQTLPKEGRLFAMKLVSRKYDLQEGSTR